MRLIDIEPFEKNGDCEIHYGYKNNEVIAIDSKNIPTVKYRKGVWQKDIYQHKYTHRTTFRYVCNLCQRQNGKRKSNFCPTCGAKMGDVDD